MVDWPVIQLGELAASQDGAIAIGPFGSAMKADTYTSTGVRVIRGTNISNTRSWKGDWVFVSEEFADKMSRCEVKSGDLVFPHRGSIGDVAIVPKDGQRYFLSSSLMKIRISPSVADPLFVFYYLKSNAGRHEILRFGSQVGTPGIGQPLTSLRQFRVPCPPLSVQSAIASLFASLDDKIESNRRMNETMETIARTIFKDWFVDFGPTRAKMEGRVPYLAPNIWSLFPDRLDAEGNPEGWSEKPLDQLADFLNGLALQKYPPNGSEALPVIKISQLRAGNVASADRASAEIPSDYIVEDGDVLFSWSGSLLHRVWIGGRGALNQHLFKVTSKQFPKWFFFHWIAEHMPSFQATAESKATTMGHIQRHHLTQAKTVVGSPSVMHAADRLIAPLFDHQIANDLESRALATTRDFLLPKLLSGEVRVKDAEKLIGRAT